MSRSGAMTSSDQADVVVVGGGTVGAWTAVQLAERGVGRVVLVESKTLGEGASSRAAGMVRAQGGTETAIRLGMRTQDFYRSTGDRFPLDCGFVAQGYLMPCFTDAEVAARPCMEGMKPSAKDLAEIQARPDWPPFVGAVRGFQDLNRQGAYKVMFFLNLIPPVCPDGDFFYDGKSIEHEYFVQLFGNGTPALSAYPAFLHVKPSEMPLAEAHAIGNANQLKAEVLFDYLKQTLPQD